MAKKTLLKIVQDILNDIDGDEVNSIDDTVESEQVAQIVQSTFEAITSNREWSHHRQLIQFNNPSSTATPTHMTYDDEIKRIIFVNYNKIKDGETRLRYLPVTYRNPDDFLRYVNARNNDSDNVDIITDPTGVQLLIVNDTQPQFYTSFDEEQIVFDSYDSAVDDTLIASKVQAMGFVIPSFTKEDSHIPDLPQEAFTYLIEEAKSRAALKLRQVQDPKAEMESQKQNNWLSRNNWTVKGGIDYPNYGRK